MAINKLWPLLALVALAGCLTTEKATNYLEQKGHLAAICADKFPVVPVPPDTIVKEREAVPDTVLQALQAKYDEVVKQLGYLEGMPPVLDSSACQLLRKRYVAELGTLQRQIATLKGKLSALKAIDTLVLKTKIDSARIVALRIQASKDAAAAQKQLAALQSDLNKEVEERAKWEAKARKRGKTLATIYIGGGLLLLGLVIGRLMRRGTKKNS